MSSTIFIYFSIGKCYNGFDHHRIQTYFRQRGLKCGKCSAPLRPRCYHVQGKCPAVCLYEFRQADLPCSIAAPCSLNHVDSHIWHAQPIMRTAGPGQNQLSLKLRMKVQVARRLPTLQPIGKDRPFDSINRAWVHDPAPPCLVC